MVPSAVDEGPYLVGEWVEKIDRAQLAREASALRDDAHGVAYQPLGADPMEVLRIVPLHQIEEVAQVHGQNGTS